MITVLLEGIVCLRGINFAAAHTPRRLTGFERPLSPQSSPHFSRETLSAHWQQLPVESDSRPRNGSTRLAMDGLVFLFLYFGIYMG